jgi:hydrogenase maturation factor
MTSNPRPPPREGLDLFLRFADGCRYYLEHTDQISPQDSSEICSYLENRGPPPKDETLKRVYHVAYPGLQRIQSRLAREDMFSPEVVREFYSNDHNRMMFDRGNLICIAYPARVIESTPNDALVELEPISGRFRLDTDLHLNPGDWVIVHRMNIIERIDNYLADKALSLLKELSLNKKRTFSDKAYKYLMDLKYSSTKRHKN